MNEKDEALKIAIEAMQTCDLGTETWSVVDIALAINACKEALEQPAQEPVAWIKDWADGSKELVPDNYDGSYPVYTHHAQPLSDVELSNIFIRPDVNGDATRFARAIEQAHGIGVKDA